MKASVIIATYNRGVCLTNAIDSVLAQTYKDIEIIVVDDGSTDDTRKILTPYMDKIKYIFKQNGGCASARNVGIQASTGDFIAFLDDDDLFEPKKLEDQIGILSSTGADFVYSKSIEFTDDGGEWVGNVAAPNNPEDFAVEHFLTNCARSSTILYRRKCVIEVGGYDESSIYNEDTDFLQKVAIRFCAVYSEYPSVRVLNHSGGKSRNRVEIYKALLKSHVNSIRGNPQFYNKVGPFLVEKRIAEIRGTLVKVLFCAGKTDEVFYILKQGRVIISSLLRICVYLKAVKTYKLTIKFMLLNRKLLKRLRDFI